MSPHEYYAESAIAIVVGIAIYIVRYWREYGRERDRFYSYADKDETYVHGQEYEGCWFLMATVVCGVAGLTVYLAYLLIFGIKVG